MLKPMIVPRRGIAGPALLLLSMSIVSCGGSPDEASSATRGTTGESDGLDDGRESTGSEPTSTTRSSDSLADGTGWTSSGGDSVSSDGPTGSTGSGSEASSDGTDTGSTGSTGGTGGIACGDAAECDDTLYCNGVEDCVAGFCQAGTPVECADDGVACTVDVCDENSDACINVADDGLCDDGEFCNGGESCHPLDGCQDGTPVVCDDSVGCTNDACDEDVDACTFVPDASSCQDDSVCNGPEVCDPAADCQPSLGDLDCNDLIGCTSDSCDEGQGGCVHETDDAVCDDGLFCSGEESCVVGIGCTEGTPVTCPDDGVACTSNVCDETAGACVFSLDNGACAGGEFCTNGGCEAGDPCNDSGDCNDGIACNGIETCNTATVPGVCIAGIPPMCFDGFPCTDDSCVELGGDMADCQFAPINALCNDNNPCNGVETCDAATGCVNPVDLDCSDGIGCTDDFCLPQFGCFNPADDAPCSDGLVCNGQETCTPGVGCEPDVDGFTCPSDGFSCTQETCDETFGGCVAVPDDSVCPCGDHCEPGAPGADAAGCTDACSVAACSGTLYQCGDCADNDGDCTVDDGDNDCFGVCHNNEAGFAGMIPGQNEAPCKMDCYFDNNSGSGNDDCFWSHSCDPLDPQPDDCECDPPAGDPLCDVNIPGGGGSCEQAYDVQSADCAEICGPVVPNGCDCFGCCEVTLDSGATTTVYLGSETNGVPLCHSDNVDDPDVCHPCTQVPSCLNTCDTCELCFGQTELPPECGGVPECPPEQDACGIPGLPDCPAGLFCLTGCCSGF
jgi:hypothetical protein